MNIHAGSVVRIGNIILTAQGKTLTPLSHSCQRVTVMFSATYVVLDSYTILITRLLNHEEPHSGSQLSSNSFLLEASNVPCETINVRKWQP